LVGLILVAVGGFAVAGGLSQWGWFWNNRRARFLSSIISQTGARIFYVGLGVVLALSGVLFALGLVEPPKK
jgi:hypothetical protein